jgi:hypothetical protein
MSFLPIVSVLLAAVIVIAVIILWKAGANVRS